MHQLFQFLAGDADIGMSPLPFKTTQLLELAILGYDCRSSDRCFQSLKSSSFASMQGRRSTYCVKQSKFDRRSRYGSARISILETSED